MAGRRQIVGFGASVVMAAIGCAAPDDTPSERAASSESAIATTEDATPATPAAGTSTGGACKASLDDMMWGSGQMAPLNCCPHIGNSAWTDLDYIQLLKTLRDALAQAQWACGRATGGAYVTGVLGVCIAKYTLPGAVLGAGSICFSLDASEYCGLAQRIQTTIDFVKACLSLKSGGAGP